MKNHFKGAEYNTKHDGPKFQDYDKADVLDTLGRLEKVGICRYNNMEQRYEFPVRYHSDSPWCFVNMDKSKQCNLYWAVLFKHFDMIPKRCFGCWKVVVRPRNVAELFKLLDLEMLLAKQYDYKCKCGMETRDTVESHYGGYFYNDTAEEGQLCYERVRRAVNHFISPGVEVVLKRGCTEFELKFGDSSMWEYKEEWAEKEEVFWANVLADNEKEVQSDLCTLHIQRNWIRFAAGRGDKSYRIFMRDGQSMYPETVKYQNFKKEIAAQGEDLPPQEKQK
jgi:hypothetical protein